jgi:hypothetical protein
MKNRTVGTNQVLYVEPPTELESTVLDIKAKEPRG